MTAREGDVREVCLGDNADPLNEEEKTAVKAQYDKHYTTKWAKIIMPLLRFKYPNVANYEKF